MAHKATKMQLSWVRLLICLILGLVTTILAAMVAHNTWHLSAPPSDSPSPEQYWSSIDAPHWSFMKWERIGAVLILSQCVSGSSPSMTLDDPRLPFWCRLNRLPPRGEDGPDYIRHEGAFGWPFTSLSYGVERRTDPAGGTTTSEVLAEGTIPGLGIRPIWPGLAADACTFAAIWYVLTRLPGMLRSRRRRRRRLCLACAYDLRGSAGDVCPECGGDQRRLAECVTRARWQVLAFIAVAACVVVVHVAAMSIWQAHRQRAFEARSTWIDELLHFPTNPLHMDEKEGIERFVARVQRDPNHVAVIADRLGETDETDRSESAQLVMLLAARDARVEYLDLADQLRELPGRFSFSYATNIYRQYPFRQVEDRLLPVLKSSEEPLDVGSAFHAACDAWEIEPAPDSRADLIEAMNRVLDLGEQPNLAISALHWLLKNALMDPTEGRAHLDRLLELNPVLRESDWLSEFEQLLSVERNGQDEDP
ncbi:MAG: hypothetical protein SYC29_01235 [Planctomycetota bacterium]|nr:hypothetical protein [Planctomycetota bacterium]